MKQLDEKRTGLLVRMMGLMSVVATKSQIQPLLTRGYVRKTKTNSYELTPAGKKAAQRVVDDAIAGKRPKMIETYSIVCIGNIVGMVGK